jgi:hypothetical protein
MSTKGEQFEKKWKFNRADSATASYAVTMTIQRKRVMASIRSLCYLLGVLCVYVLVKFISLISSQRRIFPPLE